ncbi:septum site-determining protein MinC [Secundilactobacillus kimchicus]|uniref:septum site-determining protein MinC n=1 Tax=Secundilactobacillus kimchicus TaxID=528209 RepID=UPI0024A95605|nr:septum site-determining protein MinC [Secundilactobacillus kimchicus]
MQAVVLRGNQDGYQLAIDQSADFEAVKTGLRELLDNLSADAEATVKISFDVLTGDRLLSADQNRQLEAIVSEYAGFSIHKITANVMTIEEAFYLKEQDNVHLLTQTIRNGQRVEMKGDVLFLGTINEGGNLTTSGNLYLLGDVMGVVHAGAPSFEDKLIIGDLHQAQQVRISEQINIIEADQLAADHKTVAYVNDLHTVTYGHLHELKEINPKLYHQIGGQVDGKVDSNYVW